MAIGIQAETPMGNRAFFGPRAILSRRRSQARGRKSRSLIGRKSLEIRGRVSSENTNPFQPERPSHLSIIVNHELLDPFVRICERATGHSRTDLGQLGSLGSSIDALIRIGPRHTDLPQGPGGLSTDLLRFAIPREPQRPGVAEFARKQREDLFTCKHGPRNRPVLVECLAGLQRLLEPRIRD